MIQKNRFKTLADHPTFALKILSYNENLCIIKLVNAVK